MAGEAGEYYMMGQIVRPGAYSLTGRRLTLKTAIAAAGNLGPLAWPERCTVYRRLGDREEMIQVDLNRLFAGKDSDFYIKKDDLIMFGTHPAAIFLAVVRNAFRMTYGFGFVYDRNFADVDIQERNVKAQQKALREVQQDLRFPGLFP
jgi:protein involved in polysaccharide export with SLBB domain